VGARCRGRQRAVLEFNCGSARNTKLNAKG